MIKNLTQLVRVLAGEYAWIGLDDGDDEGVFVFNDGDPLVLSDYRSNPWYTGRWAFFPRDTQQAPVVNFYSFL